MMRRTLGAPWGGTTRGGHHGVESAALSLMTPPNFIGGGGSFLPSRGTVAVGEPGTQLICWPLAPPAAKRHQKMPAARAGAVAARACQPAWGRRGRFMILLLAGAQYPEQGRTPRSSVGAIGLWSMPKPTGRIPIRQWILAQRGGAQAVGGSPLPEGEIGRAH